MPRPQVWAPEVMPGAAPTSRMKVKQLQYRSRTPIIMEAEALKTFK